MNVRLYNTLSRQVETVEPIEPGKIGMYSCGPTVYWFAHIGNMRAFLFSDLLHRVFREQGFEVRLVMNVTDVGHLVGDGDDGDDKMLVAMRREGKTAYDIADFYTQAFFKDLEALHIIRAAEYPRATQHIAEQIQMIVQLEKNGATYCTRDGIYFDTATLPEYGRLSGQRSEEKLAGARVEMGDKRNPTDFALWKFAPEGVEREMIWPSPWGEGFPGWHIECSAMSKKYLGVPFDVHTGGVDHIAVHHENEIAQTLGADGVLEANLWAHSEFLTVDGGKMSKSLGNVYTIQDLVNRGYDPLAYRYFVLAGHYRSKINFTWDALDGAQNALRKLREAVQGWNQPTEPSEEYTTRFFEAVNNDLKTSEALAILWDLVGNQELASGVKAATVLVFDRVFGLGLASYVATPTEVPAHVQKLIDARDAARSEKNWIESDRLREEIASQGFVVKDTPGGTQVVKV
jgi:cysteinyl-tRNA synthetase